MRQFVSRARRRDDGLSPERYCIRRLNFSFVLHENATSPAVHDVVTHSAQHARRLRALRLGRQVDQPIGRSELAAMKPELILTATIGLPVVVGGIAASLASHPVLIVADADAPGRTNAILFRAPAGLRLPNYDVSRLAVAGAILRPGGTTIDIVSHGPFHWPAERDSALAALEDVVRANVAQWMPPVALWEAPAQDLLPPGEIERSTS
jgi:hypothetical protein